MWRQILNKFLSIRSCVAYCLARPSKRLMLKHTQHRLNQLSVKFGLEPLNFSPDLKSRLVTKNSGLKLSVLRTPKLRGIATSRSKFFAAPLRIVKSSSNALATCAVSVRSSISRLALSTKCSVLKLRRMTRTKKHQSRLLLILYQFPKSKMQALWKRARVNLNNRMLETTMRLIGAKSFRVSYWRGRRAV